MGKIVLAGGIILATMGFLARLYYPGWDFSAPASPDPFGTKGIILVGHYDCVPMDQDESCHPAMATQSGEIIDLNVYNLVFFPDEMLEIGDQIRVRGMLRASDVAAPGPAAYARAQDRRWVHVTAQIQKI